MVVKVAVLPLMMLITSERLSASYAAIRKLRSVLRGQCLRLERIAGARRQPEFSWKTISLHLCVISLQERLLLMLLLLLLLLHVLKFPFLSAH